MRLSESPSSGLRPNFLTERRSRRESQESDHRRNETGDFVAAAFGIPFRPGFDWEFGFESSLCVAIFLAQPWCPGSARSPGEYNPFFSRRIICASQRAAARV